MKLTSIFFAVIFSLISFSASAEIVNLNKANASALQHYLKGIGEVRADNIVKYRQQNKKFKSVEEIQEVKGIGEVIYNKIKRNLSLTKGVTVAPKKEKTKAKKVKAKKPSVNQKPRPGQNCDHTDGGRGYQRPTFDQVSTREVNQASRLYFHKMPNLSNIESHTNIHAKFDYDSQHYSFSFNNEHTRPNTQVVMSHSH